MLLHRLRLIARQLAAALILAPWQVPLNGQAGAGFTSPLSVIQADPHHSGTLLAGTARALLFRSRDQGETWTALPFPAELRATLHAVLIDRARPNVYWVAVSSETPLYAGVFRSLDEGATWEQLRNLRQKQVWSLAFWDADARVIAAGAQDGVFLTRDGGATWARISTPGRGGPRPVVALAFDPRDSRILYAGTPHLAWKTTDGGTTWRRIRRGMQDDSDVFSIAVDANQPKRLFAGACSGIYRSFDGGGTWTSLERTAGAPFRTYVVAQDPRDTKVVFAGTSAGLLQSPDGGATWRRLLTGTARSIAFDPIDPTRMFVATDQGILRSEDGGRHFREASPQVDHLGKSLAATSGSTQPPSARRRVLPF